MPVFVFKCKACGAKAEYERLPKNGGVFRHVIDGRVCGVFRRDWATVSFGRVPGGARG